MDNGYEADRDAVIQQEADRRFDRVVVVFRWVVVVALVVVLGRVAQLQLAPSEALSEHVQTRTTTKSFEAVRGDLLDRRGRVLATTRIARRVIVDPVTVERNVDEVIVGLSRILGLNPSEVGGRMVGAIVENTRRRGVLEGMKARGEDLEGGPRLSRYLVMSGVIGLDEADAIEAWLEEEGVSGVYLEDQEVREGSADGLVGPIVGKMGFRDEKATGKTGIVGAEEGIRADMVLADLGFASTQVDDPERGLSFRLGGPLDMRLDVGGPVDAAELVNTLSERELGDLIREFGEEKYARRIASKIVEARALAPMERTDQLADVVKSAVPRVGGSRSSIHPATKTFQALRIAVNDELGSLGSLLRAVSFGAKKAVDEGSGWLADGARVGVISFHSLEDRPVKRAFGRLVEDGVGELIVRKPVVAGEGEIGENPRARSAKLRGVRVRKGDRGMMGGMGV